MYNHSPRWNKLEPCAVEGIFVGYSDTQKAYWIYIPAKWRVLDTIHAKFNTSTFMGGQFQAEGEPRPYERLATTPNPPPIPSTPKGIHQPLSTTTPDSPLTPLPPILSPVINIPRSCGASRVLNAGGVSTPSPPARTSNCLAGNNPQYSGIGNTDLWMPFPTSQSSAETGGASSDNDSTD